MRRTHVQRKPDRAMSPGSCIRCGCCSASLPHTCTLRAGRRRRAPTWSWLRRAPHGAQPRRRPAARSEADARAAADAGRRRAPGSGAGAHEHGVVRQLQGKIEAHNLEDRSGHVTPARQLRHQLSRRRPATRSARSATWTARWRRRHAQADTAAAALTCRRWSRRGPRRRRSSSTTSASSARRMPAGDGRSRCPGASRAAPVQFAKRLQQRKVQRRAHRLRPERARQLRRRSQAAPR